MAELSEYFFRSCDGSTDIHVSRWVPGTGGTRAVLQIAHGVAEYGKRYADLAEFMCSNGIAVVANDHLGHGSSVLKGRPAVYFGDDNGWWNAVDDMEQLRKAMSEEYTGLPYFMFGHSMGSFLTRSHMIRYPGRCSGYIICGTGHPSNFTITGGKILAAAYIKKYGKQAVSEKVNRIAFGGYNKKFAPERTAYDWLSANTENVDRYIEDPLCGGDCTLGLFYDILTGFSYMTDKKNIEKMDKDRPVLFISGSDDPVGGMGREVEKAFRAFKNAGVRDVDMKLYEGMRHEILNECGHKTVYDDILKWIDGNIK